MEDKRRRLEDLLYDFEDYTEADTFEADRFTDLQAATKALALNVIDLIKKMKLDAPESPLPYSPPASSKFPPLPPLPPSAATRSASVSSSVPGTSGLRNARPRRPPTPVGNRDRSRSPPPSLPHKSPERPGTAQQQWGGSSLSLSSSMTAPPDAMPQPLRVVPPGPRRNVNLNTNSHRSVTSSGTSRSRMSQVSAGSLESMPPPAYTAAGEAVVTGPSSVPQDELPRTATSRASTPEQLPEPPREHSRVSPLSPAEPEPEATTTAPAVSYGIFPTPRPNHASHGTRINAWVSDQAEPASRLPASPSPSLPQPQPQLQPHPPNLLHRPGSRYEPHSLQALQSLQSLTIPEDKAVGVVRPKHASVIDFSPLTPMLSQLQQLGQFSGSSAASSPSGETTTSTERLRMSPLSQGTSVSSSFQVKAEQQPSPPPPHQSHPLQTPDQTVATGMNPFRPNPSLTPLSLPAAAMEETLRSLPPTSPVQSPTQSQIPSALPEEWLQQRDHYHHRHQPPTVLSSDRASTTTGLISSSSSSHHSLPTSLTHPQPGPPPREPDTAIGPRSSLYALSGGFCPGARLFRASSHQDGVRRLAGHVAGVSTAAARCASCPYGHAFAELDLDVNDKSPRASFPRAGGVVFRMRLLYKSHLAPPSSSSAAARPSEALYGCLFCARDGATPREGDATVFRTADALLRHLARHPRPLAPAGADGVDGVTVLYGREVLATDPRVNDFDLWLDAWGDEDPRRQLADLDVRVPPPAAADGVSLPFATAVRSHVQRYAEKKLARPEGKGADALLQFFVGARIVGVEFPRAFGGKWCTGVSDYNMFSILAPFSHVLFSGVSSSLCSSSCRRNPIPTYLTYPLFPLFLVRARPFPKKIIHPEPADPYTQRKRLTKERNG